MFRITITLILGNLLIFSGAFFYSCTPKKQVKEINNLEFDKYGSLYLIHQNENNKCLIDSLSGLYFNLNEEGHTWRTYNNACFVEKILKKEIQKEIEVWCNSNCSFYELAELNSKSDKWDLLIIEMIEEMKYSSVGLLVMENGRYNNYIALSTLYDSDIYYSKAKFIDEKNFKYTNLVVIDSLSTMEQLCLKKSMYLRHIQKDWSTIDSILNETISYIPREL